METIDLAFLSGAGAMAGVINAIAGGGTLVTFPAALAVGVPPIAASATSSMSLTPGALAAAWAYRHELGDKGRIVAFLALPSALGGLAGATLLLSSHERTFGMIVPWMALGATLFIVLRSVLERRSSLVVPPSRAGAMRLSCIGLAVLAVAVYGGYFGAGKNIVLLAVLTFAQRMTIHEVNAVKCMVVGMLTLVSSSFFLMRGAADLQVVAALSVGAIFGSFGAAWAARRVSPRVVHYAVVGIGLTLTSVLAYDHWGTRREAVAAPEAMRGSPTP